MGFQLFSDYMPHPGQVRFHKSKARFKLLNAGRRYGKDFCGAREVVKRIFLVDYPKVKHLRPSSARFMKYNKPLLHYWAVAPDHNLGKIQQREIFSIFPAEFQNDRGKFDYDDNRKELRLLGNRVLIEFKSADRPESLVGVGLSGVYVTEFARLKETAWSGNIRPTLSDRQGWGVFTTTPLPKKWFLDFFALGDPASETHSPQHQNFVGRTVDNIRLPNIVEEVEIARKTMPPKYFRREYEASMEFFEGMVFDEWLDSIHCPASYRQPRFDLIIAGVDWGFNHAGCISVVGVKQNSIGYEYHLIDESHESGILVDGEGDTWVKRGKRLAQSYDIQTFYCDPSQPGFIKAFRNAGLNAVSAVNDVQEGIQSLATAMHVSEITGKPSFVCDKERVKMFPVQVMQYAWGDDEDPVKEFDDSIDPVRYAVHSHMKYGGQLQFSINTGYSPRH